MKNCKCGCGQEIIIKPHHKYYGTPDYLENHFTGGNLGKHTNSKNRNTMYERSKAAFKNRDKCNHSKFNQCSKRIEVHHIDGDITNNGKENLILLCTSHHRLVHSGKFNLNSPSKLKFRTDGSGKRRYL